MKFFIAPEIAKQYPALRIGILVGKNIHNPATLPELEALKKEKAAAFRNKFSQEMLAEHPYIVAWRKTYRSFGAKPKDYRPTAEALLRRLLRGDEIPTISAAVDSYLVVEVESLLPCGGYDLDKIKGSITLRFSPGDEEFLPLGSPVIEKTNPGEAVYSDEVRVLTRRWNFRDSDVTKITTDSKNIALFIEAAREEIDTTGLSSALDKLNEYITRFCGGESQTLLIEAKKSLEWELENI